MAGRRISPNLALDQQVARRKALGEPIVHLGFGESRLPVLPGLVGKLTEGAVNNEYGPVAGRPAARQAVADYFTRRRMPTGPDQIVLTPGSKSLLMALQLARPGDVILPKPCWVTYAPQAKLAGKRVIEVPIPASCGGVPEPDALLDALSAARANGMRPAMMILTLPDNPTGTIASPDLVRQLGHIAEAEDLLVVSDEIYRDIVHDPHRWVLSPAEVVPDRTVVLTGLSKSIALGGWRIGAARFPAGWWGRRLRADVLAVASEIWSSLAGPMQAVAEYVFSEPPEVVRRIAADTRLHAIVANAVHEIMVGTGALCRAPTGGFYVYPDFGPARDNAGRHGIVDAESLQRVLLDEFGIAVLGGHHLGDDPRALRFRAATSMLYGETEQQRAEALAAEHPLALPHIRDQLTTLEQGLMKFAG